MNITDKTAIVTGASKGIGFAISKALLQEDMTVAGWSRSAPDIQHKNFHHFEVDLTKEASVAEAFQMMTQQLGSTTHVLINNAGIGYRGSTEEMESTTWRQLFDLNVHGLFYVTQRVIPLMKQQQEGHIINISSGAGTNGIAGMAAYCGTKHAVRGISHSLHLELRYEGIKVTCLAPGSVDTHFSQSAGSSSSKKNKMRPEDIAHSVVHALKAHPNYHYVDMEVRPLQP
uniref:SDR family NAD(P)-dependent oxidoreductase n=1 Tax=Roseihalotalea indica TaxID=2867963 RepID=A0AA49JIQ9_9BACT|nr:SDR family NAD(P)-dependent oxidoreductase [Tunicatimonas sp. TK19036]